MLVVRTYLIHVTVGILVALLLLPVSASGSEGRPDDPFKETIDRVRALVRSDNVDEAASLIEASAVDRQAVCDAVNTAALKLLITGNENLALDYVRLVIRFYPGRAAYLGTLSTVLEARGELDDARRAARRALWADGSFHSAFLFIARLLKDSRDFRRAWWFYRQAIRCGLEDAVAEAAAREAEELQKIIRRSDELVNEGRDARMKGGLDEALSLLQQALIVDPSNGTACYELASFWSENDAGDERSRHLYQIGLHYDPTNAVLYTALAFLEDQAGRLAESERYTSMAETAAAVTRMLQHWKSSQSDVQELVRLGQSLVELNDYDRALWVFEDTVAAGCKLPAVWDWIENLRRSQYCVPVEAVPELANPSNETDEPGYSEPGYSEPGYSEPGYSEPGYSEPGYSDPGDL